MIYPPNAGPGLAPGRYRHFKGNYYQVLGEARHSETEAPLVIYRALYGERGLWARPRELFLAVTTTGAVRFEYVGDLGC